MADSNTFPNEINLPYSYIIKTLGISYKKFDRYFPYIPLSLRPQYRASKQHVTGYKFLKNGNNKEKQNQ